MRRTDFTDMQTVERKLDIAIALLVKKNIITKQEIEDAKRTQL